MNIYWIWFRFQDLLFNIQMFFQKLFRGWSDEEIWNFYWHASKWMLPRLKLFRKLYADRWIPADLSTIEEWQVILGKIIYAIEKLAIDDTASLLDKDVQKRIEEGMQLFGKYFQHIND